MQKEKNISKDTLLEAIEQSLIQACKNHFGKADNVKVKTIRWQIRRREKPCLDDGRALCMRC